MKCTVYPGLATLTTWLPAAPMWPNCGACCSCFPFAAETDVILCAAGLCEPIAGVLRRIKESRYAVTVTAKFMSTVAAAIVTLTTASAEATLSPSLSFTECGKLACEQVLQLLYGTVAPPSSTGALTTGVRSSSNNNAQAFKKYAEWTRAWRMERMSQPVEQLCGRCCWLRSFT